MPTLCFSQSQVLVSGSKGCDSFQPLMGLQPLGVVGERHDLRSDSAARRGSAMRAESGGRRVGSSITSTQGSIFKWNI